jgi:hypothetical protein
MVPCTRLHWTRMPYEKLAAGYYWADRKCARKSVRFFRVRYSVLDGYRAGESDKMEDIFAMCASCAHEAEVAQGKFWIPKPFPLEKHKGFRRSPIPVFGLRGDVESWEEIQGTENLFRDDIRNRKLVSLKARVAVLMAQGSTQFVDPEDWRRIFTELVDEAVIEAVHRS